MSYAFGVTFVSSSNPIGVATGAWPDHPVLGPGGSGFELGTTRPVWVDRRYVGTWI
jgi:hypothetical protein